MEMRATAQRYTGPSAGRIASLIPKPVSFERRSDPPTPV